MQTHFLFRRTAEKAADRVGLPACGLSEFWQRNTRGPARQFKYFGGFGSSPCSRQWFDRGLRLLGRLGGRSGAMRGLLLRGGLGGPSAGLLPACFSDLFICVFPL